MRFIDKLALSLTLLTAPLLANEVASLDVAKVCDVKANGVKKVVELAKKYNKTVVKHGVEFKRLGITNTNYIKALEKAVAKGSKEVVINYKEKGKAKTKKFPIEYAATRSCKFAISALKQEIEADSEYLLAIPK